LLTPFSIVLVLSAAFLHASWNALLRGGADRGLLRHRGRRRLRRLAILVQVRPIKKRPGASWGVLEILPRMRGLKSLNPS
jgi:hypothetical protein